MVCRCVVCVHGLYRCVWCVCVCGVHVYGICYGVYIGVCVVCMCVVCVHGLYRYVWCICVVCTVHGYGIRLWCV